MKGVVFSIVLCLVSFCDLYLFANDVLPIPINDVCGGAFLAICGNIVIDNTDFATAVDAEPACGDNTGASLGIWYTFFGTGDTMVISTDNAGTLFDIELQLFSDTYGSLICLAEFDNNGPDFGKEIIIFLSNRNESY